MTPDQLDRAGSGVKFEDLPSLYAATEVTVQIDDQWLSAPKAVACLGKSLFVITAWNPAHERPGDAANREANRSLHRDLEANGCVTFAALGSDPHSPHAEESWATTGIAEEEAIALGVKYRQVAIFRLDAERQTVIGCDGSWMKSRDYAVR